MHDRRLVPVEVHQSGQNLPPPLLQHIVSQKLVPLPITAQGPRRKHLRDEVHLPLLLIVPPLVETHDILVLQRLEHTNFRQYPILLIPRHTLVPNPAPTSPQIHLVPRHLPPLLRIKRLIHHLARPTPQLLPKPTVPLRGIHLLKLQRVIPHHRHPAAMLVQLTAHLRRIHLRRIHLPPAHTIPRPASSMHRLLQRRPKRRLELRLGAAPRIRLPQRIIATPGRIPPAAGPSTASTAFISTEKHVSTRHDPRCSSTAATTAPRSPNSKSSSLASRHTRYSTGPLKRTFAYDAPFYARER
mmetsp:Transcript_7224/g.19816  ORF Transcript_7224/g.19816 Transcript_7224/m.19816 type:complete len:299 (-) Transcript_7224:179-1075(-)